MPQTIITEINNVAADLSTAELADLTVYGGANPDRDELALFLYLYKRAADLTDTAVTVSNTDPLNVTAWSFTLAGDGWYRAILFEFPIWAAGTYSLNNCVYHSGAYYKANTSTTGTPGVSADWDLITDILAEVLNLSSSNVVIGQTNNFTTANADAGPIGTVLQDLGPSIKAGQCKDINKAGTALWGESLIESAWINFLRGDYVEAQEIVDYINSRWAA